jgi:hypothetical protein
VDVLKVNTQKTEYIFMSHYQVAGKSHNFLTGNKALENVAKFKYLGQQ